MTDFELNKVNQNIESIIKNILPDNELLYFLNNGSKRIRSKIAILYLKAFGVNLTDEMFDVIISAELIHNASLLHDDVIDGAYVRRGNTTIGEKYSSNVSILCGDYLVSEAIGLLLKLDNMQISKIFNNCVQNMSIAEINQYFLRGKKPVLEEYIDICKGKTAGLFAAVLKSCADLADLDTEMAEHFGEIFGICYQINNDCTEKSLAEDCKNKISTVEDILGIENARSLSDNYKRELKTLLTLFPVKRYRLEIESIVDKL